MFRLARRALARVLVETQRLHDVAQVHALMGESARAAFLGPRDQRAEGVGRRHAVAQRQDRAEIPDGQPLVGLRPDPRRNGDQEVVRARVPPEDGDESGHEHHERLAVFLIAEIVDPARKVFGDDHRAPALDPRARGRRVALRGDLHRFREVTELVAPERELGRGSARPLPVHAVR
jgi:hypothetical protein